MDETTIDINNMSLQTHLIMLEIDLAKTNTTMSDMYEEKTSSY